MKVALLGAGGQLAHDLGLVMDEWDGIPLTHSDLDIRDATRVDEVLRQIHPDIVINTAAFHRVDDCEEEVEKAFQVNAFAVRNVAKVCASLDSALLHISTDYVFDGQKKAPYTVEDNTHPINTYGWSKLVGEHFVRIYCPKYFIVRSSGLFGVVGSSGKGGNFVETMIQMANADKPIRVVDDQVLSPTYTHDLAAQIRALLQTQTYGIHHIVNAGECSWYEFAAATFELMERKPDLERTDSSSFQLRARRPSYSALSSKRVEKLTRSRMPHWRKALERYLEAREQSDKRS